ncbi:GNAT family N-acetyltransferase [Marinobacter sp. NP-4(2019)]|uniref:GNAT family N-acetyltransferase n=1 Tax=Marinobacter sp. NP-4(2019) TaxID=2488665 RepID=UPI000FC3CF4C|nr:GNAT family N-acetyltransferase [Marinobacter sp. NP-4(2019)]AZT83623.1 GNAT family N-acetyltransferase [Marinobacter sp. NP-4(2019)]
MNFRNYTEADAERLAGVFTSSVHSLATAEYDARQRDAWAPIPPDLDAWRHRLGQLHTIIAEENGQCLGFLSYEPDGHIELLYTAPDAARKGVASALLEEAARQLSEGFGVTDLYTEASLVAAPFFLRHGFDTIEEQTVSRNGVNFRRFAMQRTL